MAPSLSLQARISAFENLSSSPSSLSGGFRAVTPSPPQHQRQPSKNIQASHILDADPTSPTADSLVAIPPIKPSFNPPRSSSPPVLGRKTSLIDFSELSPSPRLKKHSSPPPYETGSTSTSTLLLDSSQKPPLPPRLSPRIPPLPPRKLSPNSLKDSPPSKGITPPLPVRSSPISIAPSKLLHSESLFNLRDSTHPASNSSHGSSKHLPASSISSFQSVSLSSTGTGTTEDSLDGSYEAVQSSTVGTSPISTESQGFSVDTLGSQKSTLEKQALSGSAIPLQSSSSLTRRRPAPAPPPQKPPMHEAPRPSPRSLSINNSLLRPVPIPMNSRRRYNAVFDCHISLSQKGHSTSGWRGSSLDLLTGTNIDDLNDLQKSAGLDGSLVKSIWKCSRLPKSRLREIWNECDFDRTGFLDRERFALGMWRIDEALRAAQQSKELSHLEKPSSSVQSTPTSLFPSRDVNLIYTPRIPHSKPKYLK